MRMKLRNKYDLEGFDELSLRNQIRVMFWTKVIWYYTCFLYIAINLDFLVKGFKWVSFDEFCQRWEKYFIEELSHKK